jgi:hypothetical protein
MLRSRTLLARCRLVGRLGRQEVPVASTWASVLEKAVNVDFRALQIKYNDILLERSALTSIALDTTNLEFLLTAKALTSRATSNSKLR